MVTLSFTIFSGQKNYNRAHMLFQVLCGFEPIFYTTHPNEESLITTHVIKQMKNNDKTKQVNFTIAIYICREYLRNKRNLSPPDVINLIEKHVLPVRPGRKDPRKVKPQAS